MRDLDFFSRCRRCGMVCTGLFDGQHGARTVCLRCGAVDPERPLHAACACGGRRVRWSARRCVRCRGPLWVEERLTAPY